MKKPIYVLSIVIIFIVGVGNTANAAETRPAKALPPALYNIPVQEFLKLTPKEYKIRTGSHLKVGQRMSLWLMRSAMKKAVKNDPTISMGQFLSTSKKMKTWLLILLIIVGALLIALLIFTLAYAGTS